MTGFQRNLLISSGLHIAVIALSLATFRVTQRPFEPSVSSIDLNFEISDTALQATGEKDGQKADTPQRREVQNPSPVPVPTPPDPSLRPVDPSSAPTPPPQPQRVAEAPAPPQPVKPVPAPPPAPPRDQSLVEQEDQAALLQKIEEQRKADEKAKEEAKRKEEEKKRIEKQKLAEAAARKKEEERKKAERDAQILRDLVNNQRGRVPQQGTTGNNNATPSKGNPNGTGRSLTQTQYAALIGMIRDQIAPCWSPPPAGAADAKKLIIRIDLKMNPDGSLNGRPAITNDSSDPAFRTMSSSAVRAILLCAQKQGGKLNLPAEMYDAPNGWREIEFAFDPSQLS